MCTQWGRHMCDSTSCTYLGKQATKSGAGWNKIQLSIAVCSATKWWEQRWSNHTATATEHKLLGLASLCARLTFLGTRTALREGACTAVHQHRQKTKKGWLYVSTTINFNEDWDLQVSLADSFSVFFTQETLEVQKCDSIWCISDVSWKVHLVKKAKKH